MNAQQRGNRLVETPRCFVLYGLVVSVAALFSSTVEADSPKSLHDFAEVYVDQYFEPDESLLLSEEGRKKSEALANYALGRSLEARGLTNEAIVAYRKVLENEPGRYFLARKTAYLLARNGNNEQA
ncbi:MAG: hypothetical protein AAF236_17520, partial [Verrucomicrobiota bacterium]